MLEIKKYEVYGLENAVIASGLPMLVDSDSAKYSENRAKVLGGAKPGSGHDCFLKGILVTARVKYPLYWSKQFQRYHFADIISSQSTMHRITKMDILKNCNEWVDPSIVMLIDRFVEHYNYLDENSLDECYYAFMPDTSFLYYTDKEEAMKVAYDAWSEIEGKDCYNNLPVRLITKKDLFMKIISNLPSGFEMEMEIVTNYLQLKTIYLQRRHHKLPDWQVFCDWIESLPMFKEFCLKEDSNVSKS